MKLYTAIALTRLDQLEEACKYLNHELLVPDIKEDENLITKPGLRCTVRSCPERPASWILPGCISW